MAQSRALTEVEEALDERRSFVVEAGAGSGKTYALVHGLRYLLASQRRYLERNNKRIACITYTNVAKNEISERLADDPLVFVGTIHEFLWSVIQRFQSELKMHLVDYNSTVRKPVENLEVLLDALPVVYSDRGRKFERGQLFHDDVIELSYRLFAHHPKIARIARSQFPYIFVDEYQDTEKRTIDLLLNHLLRGGEDGCLVGLFGDSMQKIYNSGVGSVSHERLTRISKIENYRCSRRVIELLNKIRPSLQQVAAGNNLDGQVAFFVGAPDVSHDGNLAAVRQILLRSGWTDDNTKVLMLTHRGIADRLKYRGLLDVYDRRGSFARDNLLDGTDAFADLFSKIEVLCRALDNQDFGTVFSVIGRDSLRLSRHSDKVHIAKILTELAKLRLNSDVGTILDYVFTKRVLQKSGAIRFIEDRAEAETPEAEKDKDFLANLRLVPYREVIEFTTFRESSTPFSTQHGVKGAEFDNVLVVVDDDGWNQYNIGNMMANTERLPQRFERSRNLFYVCCSRARDGLAVAFLSSPPNAAIETAKNWFGALNVHYL
ncbi:UvrD-helicase domain-containing protein [Catellatospora bangladeshensis]|uniref:DNA helicase n=1 Tax=Catellatospora bangladeshensis TaxID=310355 RepID=A0A8J3NJQ5_9ACTN|nr:UvrD-helicase domain-containing protein [Catellatospora bangladeshensis]GIF80690.1 DNA helicase [Catellatospora bangladeshensis]